MKSVFVGYFSYATNYNRDLVTALRKICPAKDEIFLCGRIDENVNDNREPNVDRVWRKNWRYIFDILNYVDMHNPEVVYLHQEFKNYGGIITAFLFPFLILILRLKGKVVVPTVHAVISLGQINEDFLYSFGMSNTLASKLMAKMFLIYSYFLIGHLSSAVTVHSPVLRDTLLTEYAVKPEKVIIIESGVREIQSPARIPLKPKIYDKFPQLKGKKILLIFGFFSPRKGFELIINAFSKFILNNNGTSDYMLVLAGDVLKDYLPYRKKIDELIESESSKKNILITGYVDGEEIDELFRLSKIVVLPAVITFNISGALAFALAYNKPILASGVGPLKREVEDNNIGLTYDSTDAKSCEHNLENILSKPKLLNTFKKNSTKVAKRRFWDNIARQHYKLFIDLLAK